MKKIGHMRTFEKKTTYTHLHKEKFFPSALIYIKERKLID